MILYVFLLIFLILLFFICKNKSKSGLLIACLALFIISAFRDFSVGTDTIHYVDIFENISLKGRYKVFEFVWYYLNLFIYESGGNVRYVLIITSAIIVFCIYKGITKASSNYLLSITLFVVFYYFFESMNITRQYLALSIIFCAVCYFKDFSNKWTYLFYYIAACFAIICHTSAVIALFIPLIRVIPLNRTIAIALIPSSLFIGMLPLQSLLSGMNFFLISDTYSHYLGDFSSVGITGTRILLNIYIVYVIFSKPRSLNLFDKLMIMGICLQNAFPYPIVIRMFSYLVLFSIISIPNRYEYNKNMLFLCITLIYGITKFIVFLYSNVAGVVPYSFE